MNATATDNARERARAAPGDREAHTAEVRVSTGQAGESYADGPRASGSAVGGMGDGLASGLLLLAPCGRREDFALLLAPPPKRFLERFLRRELFPLRLARLQLRS